MLVLISCYNLAETYHIALNWTIAGLGGLTLIMLIILSRMKHN
jgi:hypothetical protein